MWKDSEALDCITKEGIEALCLKVIKNRLGKHLSSLINAEIIMTSRKKIV